jgi:hypothetical protein
LNVFFDILSQTVAQFRMKNSKHRPGYFTPKIKFTSEEDDLLRELVARFGTSDWRAIAAVMGTRNQRQCRERWHNYLSPQISEPPKWSMEEESRLLVAYAAIGGRWKTLACHFPGRSVVNVKNRFVRLRRREQRILATPAEKQVIENVPSEAQEQTVEENGGRQADPLGFLLDLNEHESLFDETGSEPTVSGHVFPWEW